MASNPLLAMRPDDVVTPFSGGGERPASFRPVLSLSAAVVTWLNEVARPRAPWQVRLGDRSLSVRVEGLAWRDEPAAVPILDCVWDADGETVVLALPRSLLEGLVATVQAGLALPSEPSRSLVIELALESLLAHFEAVTGRNLRLVQVDEARMKGPGLELDIAFGQLRSRGRLFLFSPLDGPIPPAFRDLGGLIAGLPLRKRNLPDDLPITAAGEIGSLRASARVLRSARPGDVLLPQEMPLAAGRIILAAGSLWAMAEPSGDRLILRGRFRPRPSSLEHAPMTAPTEPAQPPSEMDLDDVEVTLVFECGRWPITLGALRTLGEGHVFELGRPVDGPVDILANGRRIGHGDIVRVGDALGVRLHGRLAGHD